MFGASFLYISDSLTESYWKSFLGVSEGRDHQTSPPQLLLTKVT